MVRISGLMRGYEEAVAVVVSSGDDSGEPVRAERLEVGLFAFWQTLSGWYWS